MYFKHIQLVIIISISTILISCSEGKMPEKNITYDSLKDVPASTWKSLTQKKIYFGHQSVGFNIMDGVKDVIKEHPEIKLNIVETADQSNFKVGLFAHSRVGKNQDPKSKIDEFVRFLNSGIGKKADAAALKFCYVDVIAKTNVENFFADYSESIKQLKIKYPHMNFIHFTVPLKATETTWKTRLKKLFGKKEIWEYDENIKRNEYNKLLIEKYQGKEPVLDIAKIQSTFPDGTRCTFSKDGKTYYSMVPAYTYDGGHLNELGRKKVAEQFLLLLASL